MWKNVETDCVVEFWGGGMLEGGVKCGSVFESKCSGTLLEYTYYGGQKGWIAVAMGSR